LLYNVIGSCADRFDPASCGFLQYVDDLVVHVTHRLIEVARGLIQTAFTSLGVFFSSMDILRIFSSKSEVMLFSLKHERPAILIRIGSHVLPQTSDHDFQIFGSVFRLWIDQEYADKICEAYMSTKN
jgi:hypothetical protein